ncbi:UDP-2,3-diacylglucosamine diphosphatase [Candidatus Enterovibrio escicola]|uniref:UDP-2,3-diacylglucosamine hydrolase n=1 Tax=Candidatus Enterovibrio escicola TaxID=1927127 RepID=A0A2A5T241_9GAMM|nr:UDP-2,3-diacylglucosamine diphosphatase [Candidatus Enterovibrio escacola]PCS22214.1 UDP-2,3-diacylglucosamine diphosphatase [Candidatus Enterovibrio escacola]
MTVLFISDLHLRPNHPEITACFYHFLRKEATKSTALYVLGDLFEVWIGDDDDEPLHNEVAAAFNTLKDEGVPVYFIHGNRDLMLGKRFAKASGMTLLPEVKIIDLFGQPTLIMHGDTLCVQDVGYQRYRKKVHNRFLQYIFLSLPLFLRKKIGRKIRRESMQVNTHKSGNIMDVDLKEVVRMMKANKVTQLIHGHTHRPNIHTFTVGTKVAQRIVLGDWYTQGSILSCTKDGCSLEVRTFSPTQSLQSP